MAHGGHRYVDVLPGGGVHRGLPQVGVHLRVGHHVEAGPATDTQPAPHLGLEERTERRPVPRQPDHVHLRRRDLFGEGSRVRRQRHLEQRDAAGVVVEVLQDAAHGRHGGLVGHQEQLARGPGRELDAAVLDTATRGHGDQPVPHVRLLGPRGAGPGLALGRVQHQVDDHPGVHARAADRPHRVGAHVAALGLRELEPGVPPRLVRTGERRQLAHVVREDQLDPQVVERAVDAEVGERRPAQLDPDEAR